MSTNNVVGAVSKPTPEELVRMYETLDGQCPEIRRQFREGALNTRHVQALVEHRPAFAETLDSQIVFWAGLYAVVFEMDAKADLIKLNWPDPDPGYWDVPMVKGLTETKAQKALARWNRFPVSGYYDDLDSALVMKDNARHPSRGTYGVRFRAFKEADDDQKNISATKHAELGTKGIIVLERQVLEPMFFTKYAGHLDEKTVTLCVGSRFSGGDVPDARWYGGFYVGPGFLPGDALPVLHARVVVLTF